MPTTHLIASSSAALTVVLFDLVWCFKKERTHIWSTPFTCIKATYVFAKYYPFLVHLTNICLFVKLESPFSVHLCKKWFLFQLLSAVSVQLPFDAVVYLRVFALYNHSIAIGVLGITAVTADLTGALLIAISLYHKAEFGSLCSTNQGKLGLIVPIIFQTPQGIMWALTFHKQLSIKRKLHPNLRAGIPFLPTVFRDGSIVLAVLTLGFALSIPYSAVIRLEVHLVYPWGMTMMSIFCCRLILNIRAKATIDTEDIELDDPNTIDSPEVVLQPVGKADLKKHTGAQQSGIHGCK